MDSALATLATRKTDKTLIQLLRYIVVGGLAFVVDFASLYVLTEYVGLYYLHSTALAFLLGLTTNYFLSVMWVFHNRTFQNKYVEYGLFGLLGALGLGLNQVLMYSLTEQAGLHYQVSKIIATGVVFFWNFASRKAILFQYAPRGVNSPEPQVVCKDVTTDYTDSTDKTDASPSYPCHP